MVDGSVIPLISGLAIGIAFVVMFSLVFIPVTALTNGEAIEKAKSFNEVQLFLKMHPGQKYPLKDMILSKQLTFIILWQNKF
ncbi:MAG: hypothetical protein AB1351_10580 [Thermoproteota archaeon]